MLESITSGVLVALSWVKTMLGALTYYNPETGGHGLLYSLLPVIGAFIAMSIIFFAIKVIKKLVYGF